MHVWEHITPQQFFEATLRRPKFPVKLQNPFVAEPFRKWSKLGKHGKSNLPVLILLRTFDDLVRLPLGHARCDQHVALLELKITNHLARVLA